MMGLFIGAAWAATFDVQWAQPATWAPGATRFVTSRALADRPRASGRRVSTSDPRLDCAIRDGRLVATFVAESSEGPLELPFTARCQVGRDRVFVNVVEQNPAIGGVAIPGGGVRIVHAPGGITMHGFSLPPGEWPAQEVDASIDAVRCVLGVGPAARLFVHVGEAAGGRGACVLDGPDGPHELAIEVAVAPLTVDAGDGG